LFVLEIVIGSFAIEVLVPVVIAAAVGTLVSQMAFGTGPLSHVPAFELVSYIEIPIYMALGLAAAAAGSLFLEALKRAEQLFERVPGRPARAALGGIVVGALAALGFVGVYGNGYEMTSRILDGGVAPRLLALVFLTKIVATAATVGSGLPGGVFTPTLLLGAALGGALGSGVHSLLPEVTAPAGAYALVGMGALLSATTRAPLLSVVFVFEVSRDYEILIPLLITCVLASLAARLVHRKSIYVQELERRGLSWGGTPEERVMRSIRVEDIMRAAPAMVSESATLHDVVKTFLEEPVTVVYLSSAVAPQRLSGCVDFQAAKGAMYDHDLAQVAAAADVARWVEPLAPEQDAVEANERLWGARLEELPVVDSVGRLAGVVTQRDLLAAIDREVLRRNVLLAKVRWRGDEGTVTDFFELPAGQRLEQLAVPEWLEGRTLAEAQLRERYGLNVLAVLRRDADGRVQRFAPVATDVLAAGDQLVVIGSRRDVERFVGARAQPP
jgi:CIC family chloride channel protein